MDTEEKEEIVPIASRIPINNSSSSHNTIPTRNDLNRKRSRSQPPTPNPFPFEADLDNIDDDPVTPFDCGDFHPVLFDAASDSFEKWENGKNTKSKKTRKKRPKSQKHRTDRGKIQKQRK